MAPQNDYFSELLEAESLVEKTIERNGKQQAVYFRRITAAERVQLLAGKRVNVGDTNTMAVELSDMLRNRHQLVHFSACKSDGTALFKSVADVQALPDWLVNTLAGHADEVNKDDDAGK